MSQKIFIIGYGDIGKRVSRLINTKKTIVYALSRTQDTARHTNSNIIPVAADLDQPDSLPELPFKDSLLFYFAPPPANGTIDSRMSGFLNKLSKLTLPRRIVYISTSGIYGDQQGGMVTEATAVNPAADRSHRRLDAEQQLRNFARIHSIDLIILRVSGIYGPGKLPEKRIRESVPVLHENLAPRTNRIHADDLAAICLAAAEHGRNSEIYNVSDGDNSNMTRYFYQIADFLSLPRPPAVDWQEAEQHLSKGMLSYLHESRRIDNRKMLNELKITLQYPDLAHGLAAMREKDE